MNTSQSKIPLPAIVVGVALLGGAMFVWGRSTAPNPPANFGTNESALVTDADAHEGGDEHGHEGEEHREEGVITFSSEALKSAGVEVAAVALKPQLNGVPFNGEVEVSPDNIARVSSVVPGRVTQLFVAVGQRVQQGQTLALIESRGVGEAQSAYTQAQTRLRNARSNFEVVSQQVKAGVFSRAPLEAAKRAQVEALADVRAGETAVQQASVSLQNVTRLANAGSYARPSLEAVRTGYSTALANVKEAQAALTNASAAIRSAQAELARRRQVAAEGGYSSRPVEEARRVLVAAQSAKATAQSEVATTRANLSRVRTLHSEGLVATRDVETAQTAFDTAQNRVETATADETSAARELERQQRLATAGVAGNAEVGEAQALLVSAQSDERTRRAEVQRAQESFRLATVALNRERQVFGGGIANRREISQSRAALENARTALQKSRATLALSNEALGRETRIYRQNLNNTSQLQSAQSALVSAQSDVKTAQSALALLRSAPGGSATIPLRAPLSGIVQDRDLAQGEAVEADKTLMTIVNLSTVHVDMHLPESDIGRISVGAPVQINVDAVPDRTFVGNIELIHSELDPKTRTIEAHAEVRNPGILRPGMFARGTIGSEKSTLSVSVPTDAVQDMDGNKVVFIAGEKAGQFESRSVKTGSTSSGQTVIKSGLKPGERIVVKRAFMVKAQSMKAELGHED